MDHATSYQLCTQADEPAVEAPLPPELHMLNYYATEIGVIVGHIEGDSQSGFSGETLAELARGYMTTLRRIRKGLERERDDLAAILSERAP